MLQIPVSDDSGASQLVSRIHAAIHVSATSGPVRVQDLGSRHGTCLRASLPSGPTLPLDPRTLVQWPPEFTLLLGDLPISLVDRITTTATAAITSAASSSVWAPLPAPLPPEAARGVPLSSPSSRGSTSPLPPLRSSTPAPASNPMAPDDDPSARFTSRQSGGDGYTGAVADTSVFTHPATQAPPPFHAIAAPDPLAQYVESSQQTQSMRAYATVPWFDFHDSHRGAVGKLPGSSQVDVGSSAAASFFGDLLESPIRAAANQSGIEAGLDTPPTLPLAPPPLGFGQVVENSAGAAEYSEIFDDDLMDGFAMEDCEDGDVDLTTTVVTRRSGSTPGVVTAATAVSHAPLVSATSEPLPFPLPPPPLPSPLPPPPLPSPPAPAHYLPPAPSRSVDNPPLASAVSPTSSSSLSNLSSLISARTLSIPRADPAADPPVPSFAPAKVPLRPAPVVDARRRGMPPRPTFHNDDDDDGDSDDETDDGQELVIAAADTTHDPIEDSTFDDADGDSIVATPSRVVPAVAGVGDRPRRTTRGIVVTAQAAAVATEAPTRIARRTTRKRWAHELAEVEGDDDDGTASLVATKRPRRHQGSQVPPPGPSAPAATTKRTSTLPPSSASATSAASPPWSRVLVSTRIHADARRMHRIQSAATAADHGGGGLRLVTTWSDADVMVVDKLRRTVNVLCMIARARPLVTAAWIDACISSTGGPVDPFQYLVKDTDAESKWGFKLSESLDRAGRRPVFRGMKFWVAEGTVPPRPELAEIITTAGGTVLSDPPTAPVTFIDHPDSDHGSSAAPSVVVITAADDPNRPLRALGYPQYSTEFVLVAVLQQRIADWPMHLLWSGSTDHRDVMRSQQSSHQQQVPETTTGKKRPRRATTSTRR
ncbi:hypothetical protein BC828DRAFT_75350 [Blastocladiella britannica]|nr:hypothetical protein BC828DRAFT_75350 [Blastocladiella britannica]